MQLEWNPLWNAISVMLGSLLFVAGGFRFRRWATDDRPGIPRYSPRVETFLLWLVYSGAISLGVLLFRQTLRHL